jgi:hypothetical protein
MAVKKPKPPKSKKVDKSADKLKKANARITALNKQIASMGGKSTDAKVVKKINKSSAKLTKKATKAAGKNKKAVSAYNKKVKSYNRSSPTTIAGKPKVGRKRMGK